MTQLEIQLLETVVLGAVVVSVKLLARSSVNRLLNKMDFDLKRKQITHRIINLFLTKVLKIKSDRLIKLLIKFLIKKLNLQFREIKIFQTILLVIN
jgi:hypothetical protein